MTDAILRCRLVAVFTFVLGASVATQTPPASRPQAARPEQDVPTFRASVRYVEVDVDVKADGQFLPGLTKDDFELFEDRQQQVIDKVTLVDIPAVTGPADDEPGVVAAAPKSEAALSARVGGFNQSGRVYAMVLGVPPPEHASSTTTSAGPGGREAVKVLARKFVTEYLAPDDLLAIVYVNPIRGQGLTSDKKKLLAAVERFTEPVLSTRPPDQFLFSSRYRQPLDAEDQFVRLYQTVKEVAVSLGSITGRRKSIILVSEGENLWGMREDIHDRWAYARDATRTAAAFNVPIHTIRARGMEVPLLVEGGGDSPNPLTWADTGPESGRRLLSEETNGLDLGTFSSADKGFKRVVAANTRYYVLGYYSTLGRDGKDHPITVRVKRKGADVSARRGVRTLRPIRMPSPVKLPSILAATTRDLLRGKDMAATLPIDASVEVFSGADFKAALLVQATVDGPDLDLSPGRQLEFSVAAVDPQGTIRAFDRRAFTLNVQDDTRARLAGDPLTFFTRLELPPGQYAIRVTAHQPGGASGFQSRNIQIPDFAERALNISGVVIRSASRPGLVLQPDDVLRRALGGAPTLKRQFTASETLDLFAEVYDSHWPLATELTATWAIARGDTIAKSGESTIEVERGGIGYFGGAVPLQTLGPGDYRLQVEVRTTAGPIATARTSLPFQVVGDEGPIK
jgi:VWFA-related protein